MSSIVSSETLYSVYRKHPRVCIDSREVTEGDLFIGLRGERTDGNRFAAAALKAGAAYALVDDPEIIPSGDERYLLAEDSLTALQTLARRHRESLRALVVALTGSNGKTTTKELIAAVLARQYRIHATPGNYNNHLGLPLTLLSTPPKTEAIVLEMGANHQGEIAALCAIGRPTHGLVTNVGEAHLEGFGGLEGVRKGKGELYDFLAANGGVAFINASEDYLADMAAKVNRKIFFVDSHHPSAVEPAMEIRTDALHPGVAVSFLTEEGELLSCTTQLNGRHNLQNVKAAIAVGKYFKVPGRLIAEALTGYVPSNQRSQQLTHRDVNFYWDAYNANPSSVLAALEGFSAAGDPNENVVILGEMLELGEVSAAAHRRVVLRAGQVARTVLLVGAELEAVAKEFDRPYFKDVQSLSTWFWSRDWSGRRIFVKGSRSNRFEQLIA